MSLFIVLILSVIEGLTEFIPISSTGHLIIFGELLHADSAKADTFSVFIQLGAILAVVFVYPKRFLDLFDLKNTTSSFSGIQGLKKVLVASLPALIAGFLFYDQIKALFGVRTVAYALIIGGIVFLFIEKLLKAKTQKGFQEITMKDALMIGISQCFALWPGMSRSGSTIVGGLLTGCDKKTAAEFSFFLAVPIMFCAVAYDLLKNYHLLSIADLPSFLIGFVGSFICLLYTSPSPRDKRQSRMPSSA